MVSDYCVLMLDKSQIFHPLYGDRLANHLPMALIALDRSGADSGVMNTFFVNYARRLVLMTKNEIPVAPLDSVGRNENLPGLVRWFTNEIKTNGRTSVVTEWMPLLIPGLTASAFHSMIRLAYALEAAHDEEVCMALAFWVTEYQAFPYSADRTVGSLSDIMEALSAAVADHQFSPGIIVDRMLEIAAHPMVMRATVQPETLTLEDIAQLALDAYVKFDDFTALHMVTACHAFRVLSPYLRDLDSSLRYLWQGILTAYLSTGGIYSAAPLMLPVQAINWSQLLSTSTHSLNDHTVKLAYTAWCEYNRRADKRYFFIANRKILES